MNQADQVERTGVGIWSAAGAADDGDPSQASRVDLRRVHAGLRHLEASPEPVRVFTELASVWCPPCVTSV